MPTIKAILCTLYKNCILFVIRLQIHTHIYVNKLVDNTCSLLKIQLQQVLSNQKYLIFYAKASHHLVQP